MQLWKSQGPYFQIRSSSFLAVTENKPLTVKGKCQAEIGSTCPLPEIKQVSGFYCDGFDDEILKPTDHIPDGSTCRMICRPPENSPLAEYTSGGGQWKGKPAQCKYDNRVALNLLIS